MKRKEARLELHSAAVENFNERAEQLLTQLVTETKSATDSSPLKTRPDRHITHTITAKDIIEPSQITKGKIDFTRRETGRFFYTETDGWKGLEDDSWHNLIDLAERIQARREINRYLSRDYIVDLLFQWLRLRYLGENTLAAMTYLVHEAEQMIQDVEVWLPIPTLATVVEFQLGSVKFKHISRELLDRWFAPVIEDGERTEEVTQFCERIREKFQGRAAATVDAIAEPKRAQEIALEEADKSLAALRIFSPEIYHPYGRSYWEPWGFLDPAALEVFLAKEGRLVYHEAKTSKDLIEHPPFDKEKVVELFRMGLGKLDSLLRLDSPTSFQKTCLNSLVQYSKAALKSDPSEKLLYIISALESILLRDSYEGGIGRNLEERMGIFIRGSVEERLELHKKVRAVYRLRSDFVHKSLQVSDLDLVEDFMIDAGAVFHNLILASAVYESKEEFLRELDLHKSAGPSFQPGRFSDLG